MAVLSLAVALAAAQPEAAPPRQPHSLPIAEAVVDGWEVKARTDIDWSNPQPKIKDIACAMRREGLHLAAGRHGGLGVTIGIDAADFDMDDISRIALGSRQWEYRWLDLANEDRRFTDVSYPPEPAWDDCGGREGHQIILHGCMVARIGTAQVRAAPDEPWLHVDTLGNELLGADSLRIGHRGEEEETLRWTEIPLGGVAAALAWCRSTIDSPAAYRLHGWSGGTSPD